MSVVSVLKAKIKAGDSPLSRLLRDAFYGIKNASFPVIPFAHKALYILHHAIKNLFADILRVLWFTPLFKSRLKSYPHKLYLYSGMPLVLGNLEISIDEGARVSGQSTFSGRTSSINPQLFIGKNTDIGWQTTIAVGTKVVIGDDVRLAGRAFLAGYPGHPLDNEARANGLPDTDDQIGDIILEQGVWLATGVTVSAGVTIGQGTIVAAGSVVTKSLPAFVLAGGVPAKILRELERT